MELLTVVFMGWPLRYLLSRVPDLIRDLFPCCESEKALDQVRSSEYVWELVLYAQATKKPDRGRASKQFEL